MKRAKTVVGEAVMMVWFLLLALNRQAAGSGEVNLSLARAGSEYVLESPRYPNNPPSFANVLWQLAAPPEKKIVLVCTDVCLLRRMGCSEGSLTIWDGLTQHTICNTVDFLSRESFRNRMQVQFRSGRMGVGRARCIARTIDRDYLGGLSGEMDSKEHGQGVGAKATTCPCGWTNKGRIVGGKETGINEYPFVVSVINIERNQRFCGGSIITPYHILTAAHCFWRVKSALGVVVGEHDFTTALETNATRIHQVERIIRHEAYDPKEMTNDIALLVLRRQIEYNQQVGPICLPSAKYNLQDKYLKVLGWGMTKDGGNFSDVLLKVNLKVVELEKCNKSYDNYINLKNPSQICTFAKNKDSCQGDSGGPLIHNDPESNRYVQIALVSYGKECASEDPAINTDVFFYTDWIESKINRHQPAVHTCVKID